jgi:hypothetical protein
LLKLLTNFKERHGFEHLARFDNLEQIFKSERNITNSAVIRTGISSHTGYRASVSASKDTANKTRHTLAMRPKVAVYNPNQFPPLVDCHLILTIRHDL